MKLLIDTNVVVDILLKQEPFFQSSYRMMKYAIQKEIPCILSATAVTDVYYLLRRGLPDKTAARTFLHHLLQLVDVVDVLAQDIHSAIEFEITDFEDAVIAAVAARNKADYIITRNDRDFALSTVPAIAPAAFLKQQLSE